MIYFLLTIILFLFPFLAPPISAQDTLQLQEYSCNAPDPTALKNCIVEVKKNGTPLIKITKPFVCDSRDACAFVLSEINTDLTIRSTAKNLILRTKDYSYNLFTIENSSGIKFVDIPIIEENKNSCIQGIICPPTVSVKNSTNLQFNNISFKQTHGTSLKIVDSKNITIINSSFTDSFKTALEVSSTGFSEGITIQNNLFEGNASNALIFQTAALPDRRSSVIGNRFNNNHAKGVYTNCTFPCTGSQVRILGPSANLDFTQNTVVGGQNTIFDAVGLYSSGIEVGNQDLSDISLFCNEISGNRGSGIVESPPFKNLSGIVISENKIWGNGLNINTPIAKIDENNCYTRECKLSCANK
jgi:hypothetical protein